MKIKVCGITSAHDAQAAAEAGANLVGLIFARSPRRIDVRTAKDILRRLPRTLEAVGVFMDQPIEDVKSILNETGLEIAQLHGAEDPDYARSLGVRVIKTFTSFSDESLAQLRRYDCWATLLDVPKSGNRSRIDYDWALLAKKHARVIVSGRLTPPSVHDAVRRVRPWGVDVCSATEAVPGRKDPAKMKAFVAAARAAERDTERIRVTVR